ncbi:MAG: type II secretion system F family protein [Candidatus Anstonellaceae archaeon]
MATGGSLIAATCSLSFGAKFFSPKQYEKTGLALLQAGIPEANASKYLSGSLILSVAGSLLLFAVLSLAGALAATDAFVLSLFALGVLLLFFLNFPRFLAYRRALEIESELPILLREFAVYLQIGVPFEKCMEKIAGRNYSLSQDFAIAFKQAKSGASVQSGLLAISKSSRSLALKRCIFLLASIYETGAGVDSLKRAAEELSASQLSSVRTQGGRFSVLAIIFIAVSALIPSFFSIYAAVSPFVSGEQMKGWQIWLAFAFVFPLLNLAVLLAIYLLLPSSKNQQPPERQLLSNYFSRAKLPFSYRIFVLFAAGASLFAFALFFLSSQIAFALLSLCIGPILYFGALYAAQREISAAESFLPDALYSAAAVHKILSPEKMLSSLAAGGFGRLSSAFAVALRRQKAGDSFERSMRAAIAEFPSQLAERAFSLLIVAYQSGADMHTALRETAQDIASFFALLRERSASLALQRYTIFASSAILVPMILGTLVSSVPAMAFQEGGSPSQQSDAPITILLPAAQFYLLICAALSSSALGFLESDPKKSVLYFAAIAPLSQMLFAAASAGLFPIA